MLKAETITVKIPAGADTGSKVRVTGKGGAGEGSGPPGDLYIEITVQSDPLFTRKGDNVYIDIPVTFGEAVLGAIVAEIVAFELAEKNAGSVEQT